ncbi:hypothetical protein CUJ84_Chr002325 [Rhizobium leguminosarum]|uniref:Uncharacterized protein n=1 Tax=Rhizobium leguminosarum TaxID=384 RepID=A0A2K9Z3K4_RHILE|nr:hypothetical protein CUJ84_Chr002325 [Rhizobium leguminosarum]
MLHLKIRWFANRGSCITDRLQPLLNLILCILKVTGKRKCSFVLGPLIHVSVVVAGIDNWRAGYVDDEFRSGLRPKRVLVAYCKIGLTTEDFGYWVDDELVRLVDQPEDVCNGPTDGLLLSPARELFGDQVFESPRAKKSSTISMKRILRLCDGYVPHLEHHAIKPVCALCGSSKPFLQPRKIFR